MNGELNRDEILETPTTFIPSSSMAGGSPDREAGIEKKADES